MTGNDEKLSKFIEIDRKLWKIMKIGRKSTGNRQEIDRKQMEIYGN